MLKKIIFPEIKKKLDNCQLKLHRFGGSPDLDVWYQTHNWDGGYESLHGYDGPREEFYSDQREMFDYLYESLQILQVKNCIIAPLANHHYFESWSNIKENDIYNILIDILRKHGIRKNSQSGLELCLFEDFKMIKRFIEGGFRYISRAMLFVPECNLVIEPHHHMNFMMYSSNSDVLQQIVLLAKKYDNIEASV